MDSIDNNVYTLLHNIISGERNDRLKRVTKILGAAINRKHLVRLSYGYRRIRCSHFHL